MRENSGVSDDDACQGAIYVLGGSRFRLIDAVMYEGSIDWARTIHQSLPDMNDQAWGTWWRSIGEKPCTIEYFIAEANAVQIRRTSTNVRVKVYRQIVEDGRLLPIGTAEGREDATAVVKALCRRFGLPAPPPVPERPYEFYLE